MSGGQGSIVAIYPRAVQVQVTACDNAQYHRLISRSHGCEWPEHSKLRNTSICLSSHRERRIHGRRWPCLRSVTISCVHEATQSRIHKACVHASGVHSFTSRSVVELDIAQQAPLGIRHPRISKVPRIWLRCPLVKVDFCRMSQFDTSSSH